jgi:hypothetical protein
MRGSKKQKLTDEELFVGVDLHKNKWHVTIRTWDAELFCGSIAGSWESLRRLFNRYRGNRIQD